MWCRERLARATLAQDLRQNVPEGQNIGRKNDKPKQSSKSYDGTRASPGPQRRGEHKRDACASVGIHVAEGYNIGRLYI